jgi:hypothetical protein
MSRENTINKLTLLETADYRKRGLGLTGKYRHEPARFRSQLADIFEKLSDEDLTKLYKLKTQI